MIWLVVGAVVLLLGGAGFYLWRRKRLQERREMVFTGTARPTGELTARKRERPRVKPKGEIQTNADRLNFICHKHQADYEIARNDDRTLIHLKFFGGQRKGEILSGSGPDLGSAVSDLADKLGDNV